MAKNCINPKCEKEIPSSATFCSFCGTQQVDNGNLSEEEKLHKGLAEAGETIKILKKSLADAHEKIDKGMMDSETIQSLNEEIEQLKLGTTKKKNNSGWIFIFTLVSIAFGITTIYFYNESDSRQRTIDNLESQNTTVNNELQKLKSGQQDATDKNEKLQQKLDDIARYCPIIIKSLKVGNVDNNNNIETDYGKTIYASNSMYLKPQIEYIGLKSKQTLTLYQKLYRNGVLTTGTSSPAGYSTKCDILLTDSGKIELTGFGNSTKGNWPSDNYRYEIWYNNICLAAINFQLY